MIKKGDKIRIADKDVLRKEMERLEFEDDSIESIVNTFAGTEQTAYSIWTDDFGDNRPTYVSIDMCCDIPITCCTKIE